MRTHSLAVLAGKTATQIPVIGAQSPWLRNAPSLQPRGHLWKVTSGGMRNGGDSCLIDPMS